MFWIVGVCGYFKKRVSEGEGENGHNFTVCECLFFQHWKFLRIVFVSPSPITYASLIYWTLGLCHFVRDDVLRCLRLYATNILDTYSNKFQSWRCFDRYKALNQPYTPTYATIQKIILVWFYMIAEKQDACYLEYLDSDFIWHTCFKLQNLCVEGRVVLPS